MGRGKRGFTSTSSSLKIIMFFKVFIILVFASAVFCQYLSEGDRCNKYGAEGVCRYKGQCESALDKSGQQEPPLICSYDKPNDLVPIVCCVEETPKRPPPVVPSLPSSNEDKCGGILKHIPPPKTGKKAFDKCIDYQQKYVYPCERGAALTGAYSKPNKCHHKLDSLIVGGTDAAPYEFPHMVLLGYGDLNKIEFECGGSIVSERFILTAGHCTYNTRNDSVSYVAIGVLSRMDTNDKSKIYAVKTITRHPDYKSPSIYNDIALIETEREMELNQFIVPACLHTGDDVDDTQVLATGWGDTQGDGKKFSEILQKVVLSKIADKECSRKYKKSRNMKRGYDDRSQLCYGDQNRSNGSRDTCEGDSGGPIQIKDQKIDCMYTIVGVISVGTKCGHKPPAIYTRVAHYLPWIEGTVWPN